jgi:S1-C subfamily serine protease
MTGSFKLLVRYAVGLALAIQGPLLRAELRPEEIYRKVLPSVMTLEVENAQGERFVGSGFLALGGDVVVTAWHVISDARSVWATFADGQRVKAVGCIDEDVERDLALVKLEKSLERDRALLGLDLAQIGTRVYVIGAPRGFDFSISDGLISQIRPIGGLQHYQISCPISPGNSGGPVLNDRGEVIAVTSWRRPDAQNLSFAVPAREACRLNLSRPATPWEQLVPSRRTPPDLLPVKSAEAASESGEPMGGFKELKKRLEHSVGKTVTVVLRDGEQESKFKFVVPRAGLD